MGILNHLIETKDYTLEGAKELLMDAVETAKNSSIESAFFELDLPDEFYSEFEDLVQSGYMAVAAVHEISVASSELLDSTDERLLHEFNKYELIPGKDHIVFISYSKEGFNTVTFTNYEFSQLLSLARLLNINT